MHSLLAAMSSSFLLPAVMASNLVAMSSNLVEWNANWRLLKTPLKNICVVSQDGLVTGVSCEGVFCTCS